MSVLFYDYEYQNTGMGKLVYSNLSGEITLNIYEEIGDDLLASGVAPQQYPPGGNPADDWARIITCYPFLKVVSGLEEMPFVSSPETRYKIGNYSLQTGNEVVINEDNTVTKYPYFAYPEFLLYERSQLRPFRFVQLKEYLADVPDEISPEEYVGGALPAQFYYMTSFYFGSNALENGYGMALNLTDPIVCELVIYYTWGTLQLSANPPAQGVIFPF